MSRFFQQAPVQETRQKRFVELLRQRQNVIACFPLDIPVVSFYALPALMGLAGHGMVVSICPGVTQIRRNLAYFKQAGFRFPEVAYLDGTQMAHEERSVEQEVNRNSVKLLFITPDRFVNLMFLELFVHAEVPFLVIEEAERLLPGMPGNIAYRRLQNDGFALLGRLPPLALMTPPLSSRRLHALTEYLHLPEAETLVASPLITGVEVLVRMRLTEHQKFQTLVSILSGEPGKGKLGQLDRHGSVLICAGHPAEAEKLGGMLIDYGFEFVWVSHNRRTPREQAQVAETAASRKQAIVVMAGLDPRFWMPPPDTLASVIFWNPPLGLEELFIQVFRQPRTYKSESGRLHPMQGIVLYTREDYDAAQNRLKNNLRLSDAECQARLQTLRQFRDWVLSPGCRLQTLVAAQDMPDNPEISDVLPCGRCDRCREATRKTAWPRRLVARLIRRWLY